MLEFFSLFFSDYTVRIISIGTAVLGAITGMLGSFAVLRRQSLLGDAISHAALPGIVLAFMISGVKDNSLLLFGALISGLIGTYWINAIGKRTHLKTDTALGIVLSVFFGVGMLLLTFVQKDPDANQAGLDNYLFGQAATLMLKDVKMLIYVLGFSLLILFIFWKEIKVLLFDEDFAKTIGIKTRRLDILITFLIVLAIVLGLQTVGVILMSAMLLAPAAAARQWTNSLGFMLTLAAILGALSGVMGTAISTTTAGLSTGPTIVIVAIVFVVISLVFAPKRGVAASYIKHLRNRRELIINKTLLLMYSIVKDHENIEHPHSQLLLNNFRGFTTSTLSVLEQKGWVKLQDKNWILTEEGFQYAKEIYQSTNK